MKKKKEDRRLKIVDLVRETEILKAQVILLEKRVDRKIQELEDKKTRVGFDRSVYLKRIKALESDISEYKAVLDDLKLDKILRSVDALIASSHRSVPSFTYGDVTDNCESFKCAKENGDLPHPFCYIVYAYKQKDMFRIGICRLCSKTGKIIWVVPDSKPADERDMFVISHGELTYCPENITI